MPGIEGCCRSVVECCFLSSHSLGFTIFVCLFFTLNSQRINQSLDLLSTLNDEKMEEEIGDIVRKWLVKSYTSVDLMITKLKQVPSPKVQVRTHCIVLTTNVYGMSQQ